MTDKDEIKFAIRYLKKGLKSKRTPPLYEVLMNELGFVRELKSEACCRKCALPNDLVGSAWCTKYCQHDNRFKNNEITELNNKLNNLAKVADVRLANWQKYAKENEELKKDRDYFSDALDKQIEATIKLLNDFNRAKDLIKNIIRVTWNSGWNYSLQVKVETEKFLKECEE